MKLRLDKKKFQELYPQIVVGHNCEDLMFSYEPSYEEGESEQVWILALSLGQNDGLNEEALWENKYTLRMYHELVVKLITKGVIGYFSEGLPLSPGSSCYKRSPRGAGLGRAEAAVFEELVRLAAEVT